MPGVPATPVTSPTYDKARPRGVCRGSRAPFEIPRLLGRDHLDVDGGDDAVVQ